MSQSVEDIEAAAYVSVKGGAKSLLAKPDIKSAYCNVPGAPRRFPPPRYLLAGEDSCGHLSAIWPFAFVPKSATPFTVSARGLLCNILPTLSLHLGATPVSTSRKPICQVITD